MLISDSSEQISRVFNMRVPRELLDERFAHQSVTTFSFTRALSVCAKVASVATEMCR